MPIPERLSPLGLPAIAAPMFLASGPDLVVETCNSGVVGTFPALNQRKTEGFSDWLDQIKSRLGTGAAPYGVNLIVHRSNPRLEADLKVVVQHQVPLVITSLGAVKDVVDAVHSYGGLVFHDVINRRHAEKAVEAGVDGIIAVAAGAGGHAGTYSPFALVSEIREIFSGTIVLSGAINTGAQIAAARMMGADMGYLGTRFIATREAMVDPDYKQMVIDSHAADVVYTPAISGVHANFLRPSIVAAGLDPNNLPEHGRMNLEGEAKAWSTVWSAGQGTGGISDLPAAADLCARLRQEYRAAMTAAAADPFLTD
ncbi:NAD(P)H-dependent flavin oxidoreductase [Pelagovum pacificum]|uniref:Nitronate monooxygenase n=1 Tax=Pelagovum pacificum TaxID=2588711 RepID=A0A5C5GB64_9RHOB|nr:nitronate monooxygenase [Pelagovum pacificum]QQA41407.1 nitronate monooxygenase [Pelagovum pacificum]TNY31790.1 nitronate monooxygenase [Pelagovum pacificum]